MVFSATFYNISVVLVEETEVNLSLYKNHIILKLYSGKNYTCFIRSNASAYVKGAVGVVIVW
jgi:hypothetical protein